MNGFKIYDLLRSQGSIVVTKYLVHAIGLTNAVLYSELVSRHNYFMERDMLDENGMFYNTQYDLQAGTGLGEKAQRTAIRELVKIGLIEYKLKGIPAKRHFKIVDNDDLIIKLLENGKKILVSLESSTDTSIGCNLKLPKKQLDIAKGSGNNTKNNTKLNNTKDLHFLTESGDYVSFYKQALKCYLGKEHPRVNTENLDYIKSSFEEIESEVDFHDYKNIVIEHFETLPKSNNGNILAFLKTLKRHGIDIE